ncbi:MAG: ferredoxin [Rickettsiales bacterium]|jgi:hypothetical protein|nr:ferredoxin [Rickettsiales bacterium]
MTTVHQEAINACQECHFTCLEALALHGDEKGGKQLSSQHIKRMMACIIISETTANMLTIHAPLIDQLCELCARLCEQCATSCKAIELESMTHCVASCQRCAKACYEESYRIKHAAS